MDLASTPAVAAATPPIVIPDDVFEMAVESVGAFFEPICKVDRRAAARDFLDLAKPAKHAAILRRYTELESKKLLEIGSGFGTNLAVWLRSFHVDGYGVEPGGDGFNQGYVASRKLLAANGLDPDRIVDSPGESLPFPDACFDIVYSSNVLEHTRDPERVLAEAIRVLRPGGLLHMEMPNHLSYFEGHYLVLMPPLLWKWVLPSWLQYVVRRNPAFARTLRTEINPIWCRRVIRKLGGEHPLEVASLGEDLFLERLAQPFEFEMQSVAGRLGRIVAFMKKLNIGNWAGRLIVALQAYYPIYMTVRKTGVR
jgi:SAM-dependent methyltransferase